MECFPHCRESFFQTQKPSTFQNEKRKQFRVLLMSKFKLINYRTNEERERGRPSTRRTARHIGLELHRQTEKSMKAIESDMRHVADIGGPADLHRPLSVASSLRLAPEYRPPHQIKQESPERPILLRDLLLL
jgi:hypothetical protein